MDHFLLAFLLLASSLLTDKCVAVQYIVTNKSPNTPGGKRFDTEIGVPWTLELMETINQYLWALFQQPTDATRKPVPVLNLYISDFIDKTSYTCKNNINISARAIESLPTKLTKFWFASLLIGEMTHVFQWTGRGTAPLGLTNGIDDYVKIKSSFYDPETHTKPGEGGRWDEGYGVTARFLEYCDTLRPKKTQTFSAALNNKMRDVYHDSYFLDLLGKPLPWVWAEYKAKYGNVPTNGSDALLYHGRLGLKD